MTCKQTCFLLDLQIKETKNSQYLTNLYRALLYFIRY